MLLLTVTAQSWLDPLEDAAKSPRHHPPVYALGFNGDPSTLWISQLRSGASDFRWSTGELVSQWPPLSRSLCDIARGGQDFVTTVVSDSYGHLLVIHDNVVHVRYDVVPSEQAIQDVDVSSDGKAVYAVRKGKELLEWRWDGSTFVMTTTPLPREVESVRASRDGRRLLMASAGVNLVVWDLQQRGESCRLTNPHQQRISQAAWSPDCRTIATGGDDGYIRLWNASTGEPLWQARADNLAPMALAYSPDGSRLAAGGFDNRVRLFAIETGLKIADQAGHVGPIRALAFDPTGTVLASGDLKGHVRIWSATDCRLVRELQ